MRKTNPSTLSILARGSLLALAVVATPVFAQADRPANPGSDTPAVTKESRDAAFDALDRNGDGFLTKEETVRDEKLAANFSSYDADHDGKLSRIEIASQA